MEYTWPKPTCRMPGAPAPKVSFVKRYEPLGWIIGTGRYVDDIETAIAEKTADAERCRPATRRIMLASLVVVALAVGGGASSRPP